MRLGRLGGKRRITNENEPLLRFQLAVQPALDLSEQVVDADFAEIDATPRHAVVLSSQIVLTPDACADYKSNPSSDSYVQREVTQPLLVVHLHHNLQ
jgi:hypothetical protein